MRPVGVHIGPIVALVHRWNPEQWFVIFTSYFDEAATHGNPRMTMGALLGNSYEWGRFEKRLTELQERYGFTIFHAKDFKARHGEFKGWPKEDYPALVSDLTDIIRTKVTEAVAVTLPRDRYLAEYRAPPIPPKMPLDSQYGICFRMGLAHMAGLILSRGNGKAHALNVVIERGHKNVGDCERIFHQIKKALKLRGIDLFGTFTIAAKEDPSAKPLMVSDFLAHTHYMFDASSQAGLAPSYADMTVGVPNKKYDAGFTMIEMKPDGLQGLKQQFLDEQKYRADWWYRLQGSRRASAE